MAPCVNCRRRPAVVLQLCSACTAELRKIEDRLLDPSRRGGPAIQSRSFGRSVIGHADLVGHADHRAITSPAAP